MPRRGSSASPPRRGGPAFPPISPLPPAGRCSPRGGGGGWGGNEEPGFRKPAARGAKGCGEGFRGKALVEGGARGSRLFHRSPARGDARRGEAGGAGGGSAVERAGGGGAGVRIPKG